MTAMTRTADPLWVATPSALQRLADDLAGCSLFGLDTESNSLFAYHERVCLIQFSTEQTDTLVDTLALPDLQPLAPLFANPHIEKIFHAAEYDLICLKRDYGFTFANIFDTMLAARILGRSSVGLSGILHEEFKLTLDKRYQRANWGKRPLPPAQLAYAAEDSHYLIALRQRMKDALVAAQRWELAQEDFVRMCATPAGGSENGAPVWWKLIGHKELTRSQAGVLQELVLYRDAYGQKVDQPVFKVFNNDTLVELAQVCPQDIKKLATLPGMTSHVLSIHAEQLLQAIQRGMLLDPPMRPTPQRPSDAYLNRLDRLRSWRKRAGVHMGVESDVILPREIMENIAGANPRDMEQLTGLMAGLPWRLEHFGSQILKVNHS
jgi:ribonuclease D